ncbi:MAG: hypothetical protein U0168_20780 [Nannocystaceae bacterium]
MRSEHVLRFFVINAIAVGLGAVVATSCIKVNYPTVAFRCNPRQGDNCPDTHFCCSDDPSTADGELPRYNGKTGGDSTPLYADTANALGTSGMCVNRKDIPAGSGLLDPAALNCPIPCNPTWSASQVSEICGSGRVCCQTVELGEKDCVQEVSSGKWRPVSGEDICTPTEGHPCPTVPATNWNNVAHDTHQDPNGTVCLQTAGGDAGSAAFQECITHLTVANQRGFCMALGPGQACPTDPATGYRNICDIKNGMAPAG